MMNLEFLLSLCLTIGISSANQFKLYNNCRFTVWPGILGNPGHPHLENGGFALKSYESRVINSPDNWAGRFWGRTRCDASGKCVTGDCGGKVECQGSGGTPPATLAEITLRGAGGLDFYDISLVDGYNLAMRITPTGGNELNAAPSDRYYCKSAACAVDLNASCPNELRVEDGCRSACDSFQTDEYCCRGAYDRPETCRSSDWPRDYPKFFKDACPDAYSYAYDDHKSIFTCKGAPSTNYDVIFCP